jgi:ribonuclease HI
LLPFAGATIAIYYTDGSLGSVQGQRSGAASVCEIGPTQRPIVAKYWSLGPFVEVADCESIAIVRALELALATTGPRPLQKVYLFVDSQAAIARLEGFSSFARQAKGLLVALAAKGISTYISWCPSHQGIIGNECADNLAKAGLNAGLVGLLLITFSYLKRKKREAYMASWKANWAAEEALRTKGKGLGLLYRRIAQDSLTFALKPTIPVGFPRATQSAYIQLKTGVGYLRTFQVRIGKRLLAECPECSVPETTTHLILRCKRYSVERQALARSLLPEAPLTLHFLFSTKVGRQALFQYLKATGICTAKWAKEEE